MRTVLSPLFCALLIVLGGTQELSALSLNRVVAVPTELSDDLDSQVQIGQRLFFVDRLGQLFVTNGTAESTSQLSDNVVTGSRNSLGLAVLDEVVYFLRKEDNPNPDLSDQHFLWLTDGTVAGTRRAINNQLGSADFFLAIRSVNDQIFLMAETSPNIFTFSLSIIVTPGTTVGTRVVDAIRPDFSSLCAPSITTFYVIDATEDFGPVNNILRIVNGQPEIVTLPERYSLLSNRATQVGDRCFYTAVDSQNDDADVLLVLDGAGTQTFLDIADTTEQIDGTQIRQVQIQGRRYFYRQQVRFISTALQPISLFTYDAAQNQLIETDLVAESQLSIPSDSYIDSIRASQNKLYVQLETQVSDFPRQTLVLDPDLNFLEEITLPILGASLAGTFDEDVQPFDFRSAFSSFLFSINGQDFFLNRSNRQISQFRDGKFRLVIRSFDPQRQRFFSASSSAPDVVYASATEAQTGTDAIYRFANRPTVSERLAGLWANPSFSRTGIDIDALLAADGETRTLTLSLLTHLDGQPFWLFGAAPIKDGEFSIEFPMEYFQGFDYLRQGSSGNSVSAGTITVTVQGCSELNVVFDLDDPLGFRDLNFQRPFDTSFASLCTDDVSPL